MNDNTVLRIKVPAHLYESVKKQLTLKEAKGKTHYGAGMEVVKEKKMKTPKDGMEKVEEIKDADTKKKPHSLEELKAVKEKLEKKINEMENVPKVEEKEKVDEVGAGVEYAWIPAAAAGLGIAGTLLKGIIAYMKEKNLKGMKGFIQAYKEVGSEAKDTIGNKMSGGMEEAKDKEKKEEDK